MATTPNTTFVSGAILTAAQQNNFPRGLMTAVVTSSTAYTLTTSVAVATGMTVTWTAVANRIYKVTYFEPRVDTPTVADSSTSLVIRVTNAAGITVAGNTLVTPSAAKTKSGLICQAFTTPSAGSVTFVGCASSTSTTGTPILDRNAFTPAQIWVEDIGGA
jgi:hypothetical protein